MNHYLTSFVERLESRYSKDALDMKNGEWMEKNTTLRGMPFSFSRYPFQRQIADDMHPNMDVIKPSQVGLALSVDTLVPTPTGWTTMGDLEVGDLVYDEQGRPTRVEYVSPIYIDHTCYEVEFDTGEVIVADAGHRWYVECDKAFNDQELCFQTGRLPKNSDWRRKGVVTTEMLSRNYKLGKRNLFAIPNTQPLQGEDVELPIDPYFLGLWLGDGSCSTGQLTATHDDFLVIREELEARGFTVEVRRVDLSGRSLAFSANPNGAVRKHRTWGEDKEWVRTTHYLLKEQGLLNNKRIPEIYLRATIEDRRALLRGLMDSDGHITKKGRCSFYNTDPKLVYGVVELIHSLGLKTRIRWRKPGEPAKKGLHQALQGFKPIAEVGFAAYAEDEIFLLPRKRERLQLRKNGRSTEALRRRIVRVERTATVPVRCISVDSPNHLFLVGRGMIPTHNTEVQIRKALAICYRNTGISGIFTMPNLAMFKRMSQTRILPVVAGDKVFNSERDRDSVRSMGLIQIGKSFLYVTGASEGDATSISADFVMNDEVDLTNPAMLALFNSRLQGSDWRISQRFSTPTFPDYGIDLGYQSSDQHEYLAFCEACNHYQIPVFTRDFCHLPGLPDDIHDLTDIDEAILDLIDLEGCYVKCERCERPLDLSNHDKREWVPRWPNRIHHRGYRVRPFSTERLDIPYILTQLIRYKRRDYLRGFYNTVLGEPYADSNTRLDVAVIEACFTNQPRRPEISRDEPLFLGIDMGLTCHLVLSRGNYDVLTFETVPSDQIVEHVKAYCDIYNIVGGGVDRFPYTPTANEIYKVSEGKVWPIQYRGTKEIDVKQEEGYVSADRTAAIDEVVLQIRRGVPRFSGYGTQRTTIIEHLRDMVRDEKPDEPARWLKTTGNDHYLHALALMMAGVKIRQFLDGKVKADPREVAAVVAVPTEENDTNLNLFGHRMRNSGLGFDRVW